MSIDHDFLVAMSKSFGLFYLLIFSLAVIAYAYRPANKTRFDRAAQSILGDEDKPWQ
jgi:cytochrome c oxidase cbb3-type subunit 4